MEGGFGCKGNVELGIALDVRGHVGGAKEELALGHAVPRVRVAGKELDAKRGTWRAGQTALDFRAVAERYDCGKNGGVLQIVRIVGCAVSPKVIGGMPSS